MDLTDKELTVVSDLCHKQLLLEQAVNLAEETLKKLKADLDQVRYVDLPNALAETGLDLIGLPSGERIEVKQKYYASIPVDRKQEAFQWLENHDAASIIKNVVKTEFGKGENELAKQAMQALAELGFRATQDMSVHPMTLKSFIKDLYERGIEFPADLFGATTVNEAVIKLPKKG